MLGSASRGRQFGPDATGNPSPVDPGVQASTLSGRAGWKRASTTIWKAQMMTSQATQSRTIRVTSTDGRNGRRAPFARSESSQRRDAPGSAVAGDWDELTRISSRMCVWLGSVPGSTGDLEVARVVVIGV